jgi:hypothetical protein
MLYPRCVPIALCIVIPSLLKLITYNSRHTDCCCTVLLTSSCSVCTGRYSAWPGQACAYKIGQIEILRLRRHAERLLAEAFSLPDFHALVLNSGAVPLSQLQGMVDAFISTRSSSAH